MLIDGSPSHGDGLPDGTEGIGGRPIVIVPCRSTLVLPLDGVAQCRAARARSRPQLDPVATGRRKATVPDQLLANFALRFTADGKSLLIGGVAGAIEVVDLATTTIVRRLPAQKYALFAIDVSPDSEIDRSGILRHRRHDAACSGDGVAAGLRTAGPAHEPRRGVCDRLQSRWSVAVCVDEGARAHRRRGHAVGASPGRLVIPSTGSDQVQIGVLQTDGGLRPGIRLRVCLIFLELFPESSFQLVQPVGRDHDHRRLLVLRLQHEKPAIERHVVVGDPASIHEVVDE